MSEPEVHRTLREAFGSEVAARLPRIESLRATQAQGHCPENEAALRDVHTLASSAVIVGAAEIAELAQAVEADPVAGPVDGLVDALRHWQAAT